MSDVTHILSQVEAGDPSAAEKLLPIVYDELRKLAAARMVNERSDHTLQATALVHEAYVRLVDTENVQHWNSRGHFFKAAAEAMRRILIDAARRKARIKRGGQAVRLSLEHDMLLQDDQRCEELIDFDEELNLLAKEDPQAAELVKLRLFAGLNVAEAARFAGICSSSAYDSWEFARAWFAQRLIAES
jgi:RNA polymerase sigma factor (TIGR02999 family)